MSNYLAQETYVSEYRDGGYVFISPQVEPLPDRIINDRQAKAELQAFHKGVHDANEEDSFDKVDVHWQPYFERLTDEPMRVALQGLRLATMEAAQAGEPLARLGWNAKGTLRVIVGALRRPGYLHSWESSLTRGVSEISLRAAIDFKAHDAVTATRGALLKIEHRGSNPQSFHAIDAFRYLPNIDDTGDYTVRHDGLHMILLGDAVRHVLQTEGLTDAWNRYLEPAS